MPKINPYEYGNPDPNLLPMPAMPKWAEEQSITELARGVVGNNSAQANAFIARAYVHAAGMLTHEAQSLALQLAEFEGIAIQRAPWAAARIQAIGDAFGRAAIQEITNLRRGK